MTQEENTRGGAMWRKRAIASVGVAAAVATGGVVMASSANAATATPPTFTLSAPAKVVNQGDPDDSQVLSLRVNNSGTGTAALENVIERIDFTLPAGLTCSKLSLTSQGSAPGLEITTGASATSCTAISGRFGQAAGTPATSSDVTNKYTFTVDGEVPGTPATGTSPATPATFLTGTISSSATLVQQDADGAFVSTLATSGGGSTALVNPTAPSVSTPPDATVYLPYSAQVSTPGFPATIDDETATSYELYTSEIEHTSTGVTYSPLEESNASEIGDGFSFDATTGKLTRSADDETDYVPSKLYYIVASNGTQVRAKPVTGTTPGMDGKTVPTPDLDTTDVSTGAFSLLTLFSDVSATDTFATPIYSLSDDGIIQGNLDGTFRPKTTVNRQQFVTFLARLISDNEDGTVPTGACNPVLNPSTFSDVPNASQFCAQIQALSSLGIVKGNANGTFSPTASVNRQSVAAFLYRTDAYLRGAAVTDAPAPASSSFTDVPTSSPFAGDIQWAADHKIANGTSATTFSPAGTAFRQESAAFIYRLEQFED